ncbi:MAG: hypothetical protein OXE45_03340 [bacterium]|nr:hypothetical protein [bacterium]
MTHGPPPADRPTTGGSPSGGGGSPSGGGGGAPGGGEPEEPATPQTPLALADIDVDTASATEVLGAISRGAVFAPGGDRPPGPAERAAQMQRAREAVRLWQALTRQCPALLTNPLGPGAATACLNAVAADRPATPVQAKTRTQIISLLARLWKQHGPL